MRFTLLFTALWLAALPSAAQDPTTPREATTFRAGVEVVTLSVTVTDQEGRQFPGLTGDDFEVLENGVRQQVSFFTAERVPLDVVLLVDTSSSMRGKIEFVQAAARQFVKTLRPGDRGAVVAFNSAVRVLQPFTDDHARLNQAIGETKPGGGTSLYTGIYVSLHHFSRLERREGEVRRSAIVLLSDGEDTGSLIGEDDLLERARRAGVPIYPISVTSEVEAQALANAYLPRRRTTSDFTLKTLAKETGAEAFFPETLADLNGVYGQVAGELATQYSVGYVPASVSADGSFRRVLVRIPSHPEARPRTRSGYYAVGPGRAER